MTLAMHHDELILQQSPPREALARRGGWPHRQMQFASIKLIENVQRAAWPKIQLHPGSNSGNMRRDRCDQNDRSIIVDGNAE